MEFGFPQPLIIPPGSGKVLKFMGVTHKLTQPQTGSVWGCGSSPQTGQEWVGPISSPDDLRH